MPGFESVFAKWVVKHRWWIIVTIIPMVFLAASGVKHLTINKDTRVFFSKDNPQLLALEALENTYNKINTVLFVLAPKDDNVFTPETLTAVEELTESSWRMPYSSRVNSISNFQHTLVYEDDLIVRDLVQSAGELTNEELDDVKIVALSEPQLVNRLVSPSGHVTGVCVNILLPGESNTEATEVAEFARKLAKNFSQQYPNIDLHLTGSVMLDNAFGEAGKQDMLTLVPIMFLVLVLVVGLSLRSLIGTIATFIVILMSMATGLGMAGWLRISITAASANAPTIILTLAVADSMHLLVTILQQKRLDKSNHQAIIESLRIMLKPIILTSVTTSIGFLAMNFSDAPPFHDLGNIVAIGVMAALIYSVMFLPALMAVLPMRSIRTKTKDDRLALNWLANFVINHRKPIFWGTIIGIIVLSAGTMRINLNDDWIKYFDKRFNIRNATDFAEENLAGFRAIEYSLEAGEKNGIHKPGYLANVDEFANWYRAQPKVVSVSTITDVIKRLNKNMHDNDESWYQIPQQRDLIAQYLLLYEMSLPFGQNLNDQIDVDKSASRLLVTFKGTNSSELLEIEKEAQLWLNNNAPQINNTCGSGVSIMWAHLSKRNIKNMLVSSVGALLLISVILMFAFGSFKLGLISLIPNLAPAFMAFGIWGLIKCQVGLGLSIVAAMTLGIVVNDTVHFMSKYLRGQRERKMIPIAAIRYSFNTVGASMWITTVVLAAGFLVLSLSGYRMNSDMGLMTAITVILALILDFLFLPTLLMKTEKKFDEKLDPDFNINLDLVPASHSNISDDSSRERTVNLS